MATIGQQLLQPESGWKRYDDSHHCFYRLGIWTYQTDSNHYGGGMWYTNDLRGSLTIKFTGTKLRLIVNRYFNKPANIPVKIDNENYGTFSCYGAQLGFQILGFEITNLTDGDHILYIESPADMAANNNWVVEAIDIDESGTILYPYLTEKTKISEMDIGDVISCEYIATANTLGSFQNLGKVTKPVIPLLSSNAPNGAFYWVMTGYDYLGRKKLVADRNIQHSISWDVLNTAGLMSGIKRIFSNGNIALGKTVTGEFSASYPGSNAVDGNSTTQALLIYGNTTQESTTARQRSITIDLIEPKQISEMVIYSGYGLTSFDIEVSDDNINFTKIYSDTMFANSNKRFVLPTYTASRYFSISNIKSDYSGSTDLGLSEIELYEGEYYELTIPTGGTSATDKDNDWDKIIVESTLNNTITAGDNNIWNWNGAIGSWTTSTGSTNSNRVRRGYNTGVGTFANTIASSSATANTGFRPMLLVPDNIIIIKSLIKDSLGRYIGLDGSVLYNAGTTPTDEIFQTYGVIDLNLINWIDLYSNFMPPFEITSYIQEAYIPSLTQTVNEKEYNVVGRVYEKEIEINDLERIKNIQVS